jgi:hypothetical protein
MGTHVINEMNRAESRSLIRGSIQEFVSAEAPACDGCRMELTQEQAAVGLCGPCLRAVELIMMGRGTK